MKETRTWIMLLPATAVIALLFIGPLAYSVLLSLNFFPITANQTIGVQAYADILSDHRFYDSLGFSLLIASVSTMVSIVIAIAVSMTLRRTFVGRKVAMFVYQFNIPVPHLVVAISVLLLFSQTGLFSRALFTLGLVPNPSSFPLIVFDQNGTGIIIAFVLKFFPFIGISVLSLLLTTLNDYEDQAATLGANAFKRFRYVLLPMMMPSILFSSIFVFAYAFGSYEVPFLLGSSSPKALSLLAYQDFTNVDLNTRPAAMAIANIITLVVVGLVILAYQQLNAMNRRAVREQ
jgi:putative spermidine/putrescine transport system permease protein